MKKRIKENTNNELDSIKKELYEVYDIIMASDKISQEDYNMFINKLNAISQNLFICFNFNDEKINKEITMIVKFITKAILSLIISIIGIKLCPNLIIIWGLYTFISACAATLGVTASVKIIKSYKNGIQNEYNEEIAKLENTISNCRVFLKRKSASCEHSDTKEIDVSDIFIRINEMLVTFGKDLDTSTLSEEEINILILILQENLGTSETDLNKLLEVYNNKVLSENLEKGIGLKRVLLENDDKGM